MGPEHALAFEKIKAVISQSARLGYPRDDRIQCMFTDANKYNTSAMVTQIPIEDAEKPVELQKYEPLGFVGHRFNATELNWSVAETKDSK
ncbi:MAG: RNase H-like domain found in reverse transcriptase [Candidatus Parcubacteria bacterium]